MCSLIELTFLLFNYMVKGINNLININKYIYRTRIKKKRERVVRAISVRELVNHMANLFVLLH